MQARKPGPYGSQDKKCRGLEAEVPETLCAISYPCQDTEELVRLTWLVEGQLCLS